MPQTGVEHMGDVGHKMLGKELKSRENHQKRLKSAGKTMRQFFGYGGAISALPGAFSLVTAVRFLNGRKSLFIDCGD